VAGQQLSATNHPCNQPGAARDPATPLPGRTAAEGPPMLQEGDGGSSHVAWWTVALPRVFPGPPKSSTLHLAHPGFLPSLGLLLDVCGACVFGGWFNQPHLAQIESGVGGAAQLWCIALSMHTD